MFGKLIDFCVIFLTVNFICGLNASLSGLYVDNGVDQTIMHHALTQDDVQEMEHEILELLGLPDRPRKKHIHPSLQKSAPKFLLDVYKRLNDEANEGNGRFTRSIDSADDNNFITETDKKAIDQSDIIMTFLNKKNHVTEVRHERGRKLWFDLSEVTPELSLLMGELRIYQNPELARWKDIRKDFVITVYALTNAEDQQELEEVVSTNTTSNYQGWLEFNVTNALTKWLYNPGGNRGLYIGAYDINRPEHEIKLDDIGLVNAKGDDEYQPFMIGYFKGQSLIKPVQHSNRSKRNVQQQQQQQRRRKKSEVKNPFVEQKQSETPHKSCQIQTLYVSFKDLKWQDWIIAPDGYGAFYCSGECNFPLNAHMNATNHAIVQTLVHLMQPTKVPKPCCAPTKLSPISVLYFLDETNVNLKKYKNMVVKSCGCH